jgi:DNA-damage-inducible protein J
MTQKFHKDNKRISLWIDKSIKEEAEKIMENLGLTPSSVVNILYRQIIEHKKLPFEIKLDARVEDTNERALRLMQSQGMFYEKKEEHQ